jgi:hypothetical protein
MTWDLLLPTIPHRHAQMCALLAELDRQWQPGLGMIVLRDNLQRPGNASYAKWQELQEASRAEYTSYIGDDDWVAPDFVAQVMAALEERPDYVGYPVRYTQNGAPQIPVEHSLRHGCWENRADIIVRDIAVHNPIRRELALLATWATDHQSADKTWAADLRATGKVRTEVWIPEPVYYYQESDKSWSRWGSGPQPLPVAEIKPVPEYAWLTVIDEAL